MKNKISILLLSLITLVGFAQTNSVFRMRNEWGNSANDTVFGTENGYVNVQAQKWFKSVAIQAVVTKMNSGQTVARKLVVQASNDGTNYVDIGTDTLTATNVATNTKIWLIDGSPYEYYRIKALSARTATINATDSIILNGYTLAQPYLTNTTNSVFSMKSTYGLTSDTVANTATNTLVARMQQWAERITIQAVVTKISGTAAGTVTLQGSNDGTNFVTVNTGYLTNDVTTAPFTTGGTATLTVTNVTTTTKIFVVRGSPYEYYRLSYTGSGTMSCSLKGYLLANK